MLEQFVRIFDSDDKNGQRFRGHKYNFANSQYIATLHRDSKSGVLHMHLDCNRIDMDGDLNDDYLIGSRAVFAANQVTESVDGSRPSNGLPKKGSKLAMTAMMFSRT